MINPSINGWIEKFFKENNDTFSANRLDYESFYKNVRNSGFIYGYTVSIPFLSQFSTEGNSQDEITKIALLSTLYRIYILTTEKEDSEGFLETATSFYKIIQHENYPFINRLLPSGNNFSKLEAILKDRIQTNANMVSKNFSHMVTNALLFIDVLAFHQYLKKGTISSKYIKDFELCCISLVIQALNVKINKSEYDNLLVKLFQNSLRYTKFNSTENIDFNESKLRHFNSTLEKLYLLDLIDMALWSDSNLDKEEIQFLKDIAFRLQLPLFDAEDSSRNIDLFIAQYKDEIPYFNYSNPIKHFYNQTNKTVTKLIKRNRKRLIQEISESRELMVLLAQSTKRDLDTNEKKKVKKQLLDICKTIPSLTIFLLPGGGILLPVLVKYIPQLLPSAFNENSDVD